MSLHCHVRRKLRPEFTKSVLSTRVCPLPERWLRKVGLGQAPRHTALPLPCALGITTCVGTKEGPFARCSKQHTQWIFFHDSATVFLSDHFSGCHPGPPAAAQTASRLGAHDTHMGHSTKEALGACPARGRGELPFRAGSVHCPPLVQGFG